MTLAANDNLKAPPQPLPEPAAEDLAEQLARLALAMTQAGDILKHLDSPGPGQGEDAPAGSFPEA